MKAKDLGKATHTEFPIILMSSGWKLVIWVFWSVDIFLGILNFPRRLLKLYNDDYLKLKRAHWIVKMIKGLAYTCIYVSICDHTHATQPYFMRSGSNRGKFNAEIMLYGWGCSSKI